MGDRRSAKSMRPSLRRLVFISAAAGTILAGITLQWVLAPATEGARMPQLAWWAALIWFPALSRSGRLASAVFAGFLMDASSLPPFGAHILLGLTLAVAGDALFRTIIHHDSYARKALIVLVLAGCAFLLASPVRIAAELLAFLSQ